MLLEPKQLQMDTQGNIAFQGTIETLGAPNSSALFVRLADGIVEVIARAGQSFEVAHGIFKTVKFINLANTSNARFLSDDGRLAFQLEFTDRTAGAFVAILPEPDAGLLALAGLVAALVARVPREHEQAGRDG